MKKVYLILFSILVSTSILASSAPEIYWETLTIVNCRNKCDVYLVSKVETVVGDNVIVDYSHYICKANVSLDACAKGNAAIRLTANFSTGRPNMRESFSWGKNVKVVDNTTLLQKENKL